MDTAATLMYMTTLYILLTSCDGNTITKFKELDAAIPREIISQKKTTRARSKVECAIHCRRDPLCVSFGYIRAFSPSCYLHPTTLTTSAEVRTSNTTRKMEAVYLQSDQGCRYIPFNDSFVSVAIQHSLHLAEANITCKNDYYPPVLHVQVNCSTDGEWSDVRCLKRLWTYPEIMLPGAGRVTFQIPGTVAEGWSLIVIEIYGTPETNTLVHTSWRMASNSTAINDYINGKWGNEKSVPGSPLTVGQPFDFRLTLNTTTIAYIYMNSRFIGSWTLRLPLSSIAKVSMAGGMNVTKVETWCRF